MVVILTVLKVTAIVLIALLSLILLLALAILFVPIRYRAVALKDTDKDLLSAGIVFSWLLHFVRLEISYRDELTIILRILGIPVRKSGEDKKSKRKDRRHRKRRDPKKERGRKKEEHRKNPQLTERRQEPDERAPAEAEPEPGIAVSEKEESGLSAEAGSTEEKNEKRQPAPVEVKAEKSAEEVPAETEPETDVAVSVEEDSGFFSKIPDLCERIFNFLPDMFERICDFFSRLIDKIRAFLERAAEIFNNVEFFIAFINDDNTREQIANITGETLKLLKHIRPRRMNVCVVAGSKDPEIVGQVLAALAVGQVFLNNRFDVTPCFGREIIDFDIMMRGRAIVFVVLLAAYRVFCNKGYKQMRNAYRNKRI